MAELKFACPQCGQNIQCDTGYSGMQIDCPACQQAIVVPQAPRASAPVPPKSRMLKKVLVIVASGLVLAGLVIGGWYGYSKIRIHKSMKEGLVALWSGEGDGKDSVGGNTMELTDISFEKGKMGQAFSFNGKSSSIKIPASSSLNVGADGGFTIMAWIKPSDVDGPHPIFQWSDSGTPLIFGIGLRPSESGVLCGVVTGASGKRFVLSNPGALASDSFQHIALTYDKASGLGKIYLNGIVVAQRQLRGTVSSKGALLISQRNTHQGDWSSNRSFGGLMDEIAIYNRALSDAEVQAICAEQNHGEPLSLPDPSTGWFENWMR
jgi:hypothetical protein